MLTFDFVPPYILLLCNVTMCNKKITIENRYGAYGLVGSISGMRADATIPSVIPTPLIKSYLKFIILFL